MTDLLLFVFLLQFVVPVSLTVLYLAVIGFNGILAEEYVNQRKMEVEHRRNNFGNLTETRDHHSGHGHNRGPYPSTSQDKYKRPKPDYLAPKPQSRPSTSSHLPSKALNQAPAYKAASNTPPSYSSPAYTSPVYTPPVYKPVAYSHPAYSPPTNKPPAYNSPTYSPPAYNPPAYSSPAYTPTGVETPAYTESPVYKPPVHSPLAYPSPAYSEAPPSEPEYPYKHIPETNNGVNKGISFNNDFPKFDDFIQHVENIKFDKFKI